MSDLDDLTDIVLILIGALAAILVTTGYLVLFTPLARIHEFVLLGASGVIAVVIIKLILYLRSQL
jgi:hypothetical protein